MKIWQGIVYHPSTSLWDRDHDNFLPAVRKYLTCCCASCHGQMSERNANSRPTYIFTVHDMTTIFSKIVTLNIVATGLNPLSDSTRCTYSQASVSDCMRRSRQCHSTSNSFSSKTCFITYKQQQNQQWTTNSLQMFNPLKPSFVIWLHFECSAPYRPNLPFLISDIRALWHSGLSARVPECQK